MWQDTLRVCKEYVPHKLQALQDEYDRETMANSTRYPGFSTIVYHMISRDS